MSERRQIVPLSRALLPQATLLVERALDETPYLEGALDALRSAVSAPGADGRALASMAGDRMDGLIVYGFFGGSSGAARLQLTVVASTARRSRVGHALAEEAIAALRANGARFILVELPDDPVALAGACEFLGSLGFRQESRIEHFYREGVALSFMRRENDAR